MISTVILLLVILDVVLHIVSVYLSSLLMRKVRGPSNKVNENHVITIEGNKTFDEIVQYADKKNIDLLIRETPEGIICSIEKNSILKDLFNVNETEGLSEEKSKEFVNKIINEIEEETENA